MQTDPTITVAAIGALSGLIVSAIGFAGAYLKLRADMRASEEERDVSREEALNKRDAALWDRMEAALFERDDEIADLNEQLKAKDREITSLRHLLDEREKTHKAEIQSLQQQLNDREGEMEQLRQRVTKQEGEVTKLRQALKDKDNRIAELLAKLNEDAS